MEANGILPCSQEPAAGPYPALAKFSPQAHALFIKINLHFNFVFTCGSSLQVFKQKFCMHIMCATGSGHFFLLNLIAQ